MKALPDEEDIRRIVREELERAREQEPIERKWVGLKEAMHVLGVGERSVRNYCKDGTLAHSRPGGRGYRFLPEDLDAFIAKHQRGPRAA